MSKGIRNRKLICTALFAAVFLLFSAGMCSAVRAADVQKVHTIYWKAKLRREVKVNGKKIKRGTKVTVIDRGYSSRKKSTVKYKNFTFKVSESGLSYICDLASSASKGDYTKTTKESFINHKKSAVSKTSWLVWVSLDKQRVNVFQGSRGNWKLVKVCHCSTGKASTPTLPGWNRVDFKKMYVDGCKYYTEVNGSGIHRWPGTLNKKLLGRHTVSHGCIRLTEKNAKWIYTHIPKKTTVYVY